MTTVHAYAATAAGAKLQPFEYQLGPIGPSQVDIKVEYCGICHSDLAMLHNHWGLTQYPFVPGHEVVGTIAAMGEHVRGLSLGQRVGLGWFSGSCLHCRPCLGGDQNLCATAEQTIVGRHGGFADIVRASAEWAVPLPAALDPAKAGPLFCGGITVFNPIVQFGVRPTHRVGVIGIGGLGHLAVKFLSRWGCEVTAFTSSAGKEAEAKAMGAHHVVRSNDAAAMKKLAGTLDFILNTANADLDWGAFLTALAPRGRLHTVGTVPQPIPAPAFPLITGQKSISGSPLGSPATTMDMLDFCARHDIHPTTQMFSFSQVNEALAHLHDGKARYRVVLQHTA